MYVDFKNNAQEFRRIIMHAYRARKKKYYSMYVDFKKNAQEFRRIIMHAYRAKKYLRQFSTRDNF